MELHRFFRYAIEKMCKEKKSLNHFIKIKEFLLLELEIFYMNKFHLRTLFMFKKIMNLKNLWPTKMIY